MFRKLYFISVHLFLVIILLNSDFTLRVRNKIGSPPKPPEFTKFYYDMVAYHSRMDKNIPDASIFFLGDSITQSLSTSAISPNSINWGIGNDTTLGLLTRIRKSESIKRAKIVVIAIGVNDYKFRNNKKILYNYKRIIEAIPGNVIVLFSAILPIDEDAKYKSNVTNRANRKIRALNNKAEKLFLNYSNAYYLDITNLMVDSKGNLLKKYHTGDGIHLSRKGYEIWISSLKKTMDRII